MKLQQSISHSKKYYYAVLFSDGLKVGLQPNQKKRKNVMKKFALMFTFLGAAVLLIGKVEATASGVTTSICKYDGRVRYCSDANQCYNTFKVSPGTYCASNGWWDKQKCDAPGPVQCTPTTCDITKLDKSSSCY